MTAETVIRPGGTWKTLGLSELWEHRDLVYYLMWRDVKVRYKQTFLGAAWAILQPTLLMVVLGVFLGRVAKLPTGGIPYPIFVYAGLWPWLFLSGAVTATTGSVVESERLVSKVYFPRLVIPFAAVGTAIVDFLVAGTVMLLLMAIYGIWPGWGLVWIPLLAALLLLTALGIGTFLTALNVKYRDFRYVVPFLVQLWLFATPSIYMQTAANTGNTLAPSNAATLKSAAAPQSQSPSADSPTAGIFRKLLILNPAFGLIASFRTVLLGTPLPWPELLAAAALAITLFLAGCAYFRRVEDDFADVI